eukprot:CAMPEP_0203675914 /NCGR_PEP_ID=MMETSP0090-20130426/22629_1 /ASSEMBLY_ACC=CAM_ASM_001088 /TAXON_ID=426623 /ORGANISM="Chaetoceros affinis, Strain CCMP159" /LENGTH=312 /DNA_ID=CAMNT_0050542281 /DNA_START=153 /DNA_END=1091 /DNA_ORIENTATION=+
MILKLPIVALLSVPSIDAFTTSVVPVRQHQNQILSSPFGFGFGLHHTQNRIILNAASSAEGSPTEDEKVEQVEAELTDEEPKEAEASSEEEGESEAEAAEEEEEEEEKEPEEDPEITALKNRIAELESTLKQKNRELNTIERNAEEYTKGGYARKVAEMESFRRSKSAASTDVKVAARAVALQSFLPIMDRLKGLTKEYEGNEFAKSYSALGWDFVNAMKDLGVVEYTVKEGDVFDSRRVVAVEEVYSDTVEKGVVISPVEIGFELEGNVMKLASAVVSLGPEPVVEEEEEEAEGESEEGEADGESEGGESA